MGQFDSKVKGPTTVQLFWVVLQSSSNLCGSACACDSSQTGTGNGRNSCAKKVGAIDLLMETRRRLWRSSADGLDVQKGGWWLSEGCGRRTQKLRKKHPTSSNENGPANGAGAWVMWPGRGKHDKEKRDGRDQTAHEPAQHTSPAHKGVPGGGEGGERPAASLSRAGLCQACLDGIMD